MKEWWGKYYIHVILVGLVAVVGGVAAYLYIEQFGANGFSNKSEDWANFATYISGTVGVAAVVATLVAFVITLKQQTLMIHQQKIQIEQADKHQERLSAYQRASELLPNAIKVLDFHLDSFLGNSLDQEFFDAFNVVNITRRHMVIEFFRDKKVILDLMEEELATQNVIGGFVTSEAYKLAKFVAEILGDAPDLYDIVMMQLKGYREVLTCTMAYQRKNRPSKEWLYISRIFRFPEEYESWGEPESNWEKLGREKKS